MLTSNPSLVSRLRLFALLLEYLVVLEVVSEVVSEVVVAAAVVVLGQDG